MIKIDNRLKTCADMVNGNGIVCDVGTDHAYLSVYLIQAEICSKVIASDIVDGPLYSAEQTIKRYGLEDKVSIVKSDGLKNVDLHGVSDIIIAGLGGESILSIIRNEPLLKKLDVSLILQPMTKAPLLRKELYADGFEIVKEVATKVGEKFYTVMNVKYTGFPMELSEFTSKIGKINFFDDISKEYALAKVQSLRKLVENLQFSNLESSNLIDVANLTEYYATGKVQTTIRDVYNVIDDIAPFSTQEKWDNSGFLIGDLDGKVSKVLVTLDITNEVIQEAIQRKCELIVSHHPVIFQPLKSISSNSMAYKLIQNNISAICCHTPLDICNDGINDILYNILKEPLSLGEDVSSIEDGLGRIVSTSTSLNCRQIAMKLKEVLGCPMVKYLDIDKPIRKVAFCGGSGGSMIEEVISLDGDLFITGDLKHDRWLYAYDNNLSLFDCGHFYTENIIVPYLRQYIYASVPNIEVFVAYNSRDVVKYI
ncbi:MAG: Nif3-like dinuclear metal center hexameric protein [Oscillospiraceae bacterium]